MIATSEFPNASRISRLRESLDREGRFSSVIFISVLGTLIAEGTLLRVGSCLIVISELSSRESR